MARLFNFMNILLFLITICICLAFLNVEHFYPWSTYDTEKYIFYASSLLFIYFIVNNKKSIKIDTNIIFLILLFLCSLFSYQLYSFQQYFYIFNFYLLNLIILCIILKNHFNDSDKLLITVMVALVISGVLSSVLSIYQWLDFEKGSFWLYEPNGSRLSANLAQPNHLATLLLLSLLSCLYFFEKLKTFYLLMFIPLLLFSLVLTQSRSAWLALLIIMVLIFFKWKKIEVSLRIIILSLIPIYIGMACLLSENNQVHIVGRVNGGFERLEIWKDFFSIYPYVGFWGSGWKNIEYYQFQYANNFPSYISSYHNLLLDLIVIFGFLGGIFFIYVFLNLLRIFLKIDRGSDLIVFLMLYILINHALLEFPLFYGYFLFVFCILYFYLGSRFPLISVKFNIGNSFFSILVVIVIVLSFLYTQSFEKNRSNYRAAFLGYCVPKLGGDILFDEFNNQAFINCKENISLKNISYFESGLLSRPSSNNILKLIYVYHQLGEYKKRDQLLKKYNSRYLPQYNLSDVLKMKFY
ncbi:hypothetical protein FYN22_01320 [Acinetobacter johnsonii]|nr:hypothetical protein FYN22_01320 [Acinetobacter johnsonii]